MDGFKRFALLLVAILFSLYFVHALSSSARSAPAQQSAPYAQYYQ